MPLNDSLYNSPHWRTLRQRVFERDDYRCVLCDGAEALECHHRTYVRKGKEELRDCYTLCKTCHDVVTDHQRRLRFAGRILPLLEDAVSPQTVLPTLAYKEVTIEAGKFHIFVEQKLLTPSTYTEVVLETNTVVPVDRTRAAHDALWTTRRSLEPLDESH